MALAHPLHLIKSRSRNKRRDLWDGWCVSSGRPWSWSVYAIYYHIHNMYYSCILSNWNKLFLKGIYVYQGLVWPWRCVGWYDTVILSCLVSNVYFSCIVKDSQYHIIWILVQSDVVHWSAAPQHSIYDWFWGVRCSGVECHYVLLLLIPL